MNFRDQNDLFKNGEIKVNYALSYVKGTALDCLEPALLDCHNTTWLMNCDLFITELENTFGTFNPKGNAEAELKQLHMHENHQAMKYFIKFLQLATQVRWGDGAFL